MKLQYMSVQDEGELVSEERYLAEILAWSLDEYPGVKFTLDKVKKIHKMALNNQYPEDNIPDEAVMVYERLAGDIEYARELEAELSEPIIEPVHEDQSPVDTEESVALIEASKQGVELNSFSKKFDLGSGMTQCVPRGDVTMADWVTAFSFGLALESGSQWIIGDSVVALEDAGHDNVVNQLCSQFKKSYSTVSGYARACRAFPAKKRDPMLPFSTYREIGNSSLPPQQMAEMVETAKTEKLSCAEVRSRVRGDKEKSEIKPHRYLVLNISNFSNSEVVREAPDKIEAHQLVIDLRSQCWLDPAENEWMNFLKGA